MATDTLEIAADVEDGLDEKYRSRIADVTEYPFEREEVAASVVVVTYRTTRRELAEVFEALEAQTCDEFETIVVDNGTDWDVESALASYDHTRYYLRMVDNEGVTFARNLGATIAAGDVLVFLDDDGFPQEDFVEHHLAAHEREGVVAARGKVRPKEPNVYTDSQGHYDLGDEIQPSFIGTECNASFDAEAFLDVSGFDETIPGRAGHEGLEITYRLIQNGYDRDQIIYYPDAVTYHDFASDVWDYVEKQIERKRNDRYFKRKYPDLWEFGNGYLTDEDHLDRRLPLRVVNLLVAGWVELKRAVPSSR